jgi:hypothetical protein
MDLFSFLSFHFMCVTVTVVIGHSMALSRRSHLFSTMSSLHDVLVHDKIFLMVSLEWMMHIVGSIYCWWVEYNVASREVRPSHGPLSTTATASGLRVEA